MTQKQALPSPARMSDDAVKAKTGKVWSEWFDILDAAGARSMSHTQIAAHIYERHGIPGWWAQSVAVAYEQARGLRAKHEMPDGYQVSASKTVDVPLAALYDAWATESVRRRWLPEAGLTVRKVTPNKSMRVTWSDGATTLEVNFYNKGESKSQVTVQHGKIPDAAEAQALKGRWKEALERLKAALSG